MSEDVNDLLAQGKELLESVKARQAERRERSKAEPLNLDPVDRTGWPPGPWDLEGDREEWVDPITGLQCLAKRNRMGTWCGYVAVPPGHPWHGSDYNDLDVNVHGGLNYADSCDPGNGICHVAPAGQEDDLWWLGFDCAHFMDLVPRMQMMDIRDAMRRSAPDLFEEINAGLTYRDLAYVKVECSVLAQQAKIVS